MGENEQELIYRSVIGAMAEGVVVQDSEGGILACNAAAERILGLTRDQMSGRSSLDPRWRAIHDDGSPFPGDSHPAMVTLRTGEACHDVIMGVHKPDGQLTWISVNTEPIAGTGPRSPRVVCTFTDITAHRKALLDLQASEARMQLAMGAARLGTWQWDIAEDRVIWSDMIEDLFGVERGSFRGGFSDYAGLIHADDRAAVTAEIDAVMRGERDTFHLRHRVGSGNDMRWIEGHGRLFRDAQGRPMRMAGVAIDITELHRLEQQVQQSQRLEAVGRLAGGIAHDFNNVLTIVFSAVDLAARHAPSAAPELDMIREAAQRAAKLTNQLLAFARRRVDGVENIDLGALVDGLRPLLARLLGERIVLDVRIAPGSWFVHADASQLEQVLINLVANARDAIPDTGHVAITLEPARDGDQLVLAVEDDGTGMPPEVLERVFEPFFTTKQSGTGLGLATSYGIARQHGGSLAVTSAVGRGARFELRLPRSKKETSAATPAPAVARRRVRGTETVLVVEDDQLIRGVAERVLCDQGYRVLLAGDGVEALALADRHGSEIALVLTDAMMPRMGGVELAMRLRERRPALPVLVLSGYDAPDRPVSDLPQLAKPFTPDELTERVRDLLDRSAG